MNGDPAKPLTRQQVRRHLDDLLHNGEVKAAKAYFHQQYLITETEFYSMWSRGQCKIDAKPILVQIETLVDSGQYDEALALFDENAALLSRLGLSRSRVKNSSSRAIYPQSPLRTDVERCPC